MEIKAMNCVFPCCTGRIFSTFKVGQDRPVPYTLHQFMSPTNRLPRCYKLFNRHYYLFFKLYVLVLGKYLISGILPDPSLNPGFNWILANPDSGPGTLGFVLNHLGFVAN
jgi:hypothetical protein